MEVLMKLKSLILITSLFILSYNCAWSASFDCRKATTQLDKLICADSDLSALDSQVAAAYNKVLTISPNKESVISSQKEWLKSRHVNYFVVFLKYKYMARLYTLNNQYRYLAAGGKRKNDAVTPSVPNKQTDIQEPDKSTQHTKDGTASNKQENVSEPTPAGKPQPTPAEKPQLSPWQMLVNTHWDGMAALAIVGAILLLLLIIGSVPRMNNACATKYQYKPFNITNTLLMLLPYICLLGALVYYDTSQAAIYYFWNLNQLIFLGVGLLVIVCLLVKIVFRTNIFIGIYATLLLLIGAPIILLLLFGLASAASKRQTTT
jgi:uncharacterized protein